MSTPNHPPPYHLVANNNGAPSEPPRDAEDWEDWDDDEVTPIDNGEQILLGSPIPAAGTTSSARPSAPNPRLSRSSVSRINRLKSRKRQKAQNAQAGITLITDMAAFKRSHPGTYQLRTPDGQPAKFVDAAALKALEGEPSSASRGNWNWLRKNKGQSPASATPQSSARTPGTQLSPEDRPIVIGIALPSEEASDREISPQTANINTPIVHNTLSQTEGGASRLHPTAQGTASSVGTSSQQPSVWSPDTPDTASSFTSSRAASSVYSQATNSPPMVTTADAPPVPAVPKNFKKTHHQRLISLEVGPNGDDSDGGTPCTLFEEDGIPSPLKISRAKAPAVTPDSAGSRSHGWWDHVVTPFVDKRLTFSSRKQRLESPKEEAEVESCPSASTSDSPGPTPPPKPTPRIVMVKPPIVRIPTPRRTPSPRANTEAGQSSSARSSSTLCDSTAGEKPRIVVTDAHLDQPPPYSPPKTQVGPPVRYRAVFPPGHPLQAQFPPSPGPASPGLAATMTSQGATQMTEIPLTPTVRDPALASQVPLPTRPIGTSLPQEHSHSARGRAHKVERQRRRHEKEEVAARRLGGFWRGRGCIPSTGCFGRTGREGRQKRRVKLAIWGVIIALMILIITLSVVLTRKHKHQPAPSIWVNLTDFPPMPTGVLTVVGPDNPEANTICTSPSTVWSCSLPKEQHGSVAPYKPSQPTFILQIQWDNGTTASWDVPNGDEPAPISRRGLGSSAQASSWSREKRTTSGFQPSPSPPSYQETWFLGETTDDIRSDQKAGEAAPFFISLLGSLDDTVAFPNLTKRDSSSSNGTEVGGLPLSEILPSPDLLDDGTPAPAVMIPTPVQQPVRLFDRGLPTEHYGFYTHFDRTIFLKSVTALNDTAGNVPLDEDGGCAKTEANYLVTWGQTRVLVQMWTRLLSNTTSLVNADGMGRINGSSQLIRPGTMPYPVTVTLDTHGGDPKQKITWEWPMDDRQKLDTDDAKLLENSMGLGGTWINPRGTGNPKFGGFDGGTGGCKCQWVNWVGLSDVGS